MKIEIIILSMIAIVVVLLALFKIIKYIRSNYSIKPIKIILYFVLMCIDIYVLGVIDFIEHKLYGVLFVVINACLIAFIRYGGRKKR